MALFESYERRINQINKCLNENGIKDIEEAKANLAIPFCEKKNCIEIDIQTVNTQDAWMNQWIEESQSKVIQDQIGLKQAMTLQQAVNAYVKKSDEWQKEFEQLK